ncbi:TA system VapC family ribonuclease toxin [Thermithiobacillus plumbiphilus]|uniref:Ribonuclease VapC n=1 Tax=Thermithiobacillus plumbiphilus TaxID=1729899 RepID=A0ABU9D7J1_9PROT
MRALLDVNVLIALLDAGHLYHRRAMAWLEEEIHHGWASCPITQNGCLRILSQPAYPNVIPVGLVAERLAEATSHPAHAFWPDDVSLLDEGVIDWEKIMGHRQITDAYLLAMAQRRGGRFVTFDTRIALNMLPGVKSDHLVVLT